MMNMRRLPGVPVDDEHAVPPQEDDMVVGVMTVFAQLHSPISLKDKRRIVKSALATG